MPVPYSNDLRKKAIYLITKLHKSQVETSCLLNIHKSTIQRWCKRYRDQGSCVFNGYSNNKNKIKIVDLNEIELLLKKNPFITAKAISLELSVKVSKSTVLNYIKKLGYTFKKTPNCTEREMKKKEEYFWRK